MFIQIHTLTSYPASLLNRDEAGLAKRLPFGNAERLRVSSQCRKRHWRDRLVAELQDIPDGFRTRYAFSRNILPYLISEGVSEDVARAVAEEMRELLLSSKDRSEDNEEDSALSRSRSGDSLQPKQAVYFSAPELTYLRTIALEAAMDAKDAQEARSSIRRRLTNNKEKSKKKSATQKQELRDNFQAMLKAAGVGDPSSALTAALFGRFVTSDILARVDAPVHVAHEITVHAARTDLDYFTVVDDLNREDESGAAHANETELGAGVYYGYVVIDLPLLVSNLTGCKAKEWRDQDHTIAQRIMKTLIRTIAVQSPGAKLGATAPYSRAECVLLEAGTTQPRTLANAYLEALKPNGDLMQHAVDAMANYVARVDAMYGPTAEHRALACLKDSGRFAPIAVSPLEKAIDTVVERVLPRT